MRGTFCMLLEMISLKFKRIYDTPREKMIMRGDRDFKFHISDVLPHNLCIEFIKLCPE